MKFLFGKGKYKDRIKTFIALDDAGSGADITRGAVGSKRYRVTYKGPGGHSYSAFGLVSPTLALGQAIAAIQVRRLRAEVVVEQLGMLVGLGGVDGNPADAVHMEPRDDGDELITPGAGGLTLSAPGNAN